MVTQGITQLAQATGVRTRLDSHEIIASLGCREVYSARDTLLSLEPIDLPRSMGALYTRPKTAAEA
jgi:hypothetical protein